MAAAAAASIDRQHPVSCATRKTDSDVPGSKGARGLFCISGPCSAVVIGQRLCVRPLCVCLAAFGRVAARVYSGPTQTNNLPCFESTLTRLGESGLDGHMSFSLLVERLLTHYVARHSYTAGKKHKKRQRQMANISTFCFEF